MILSVFLCLYVFFSFVFLFILFLNDPKSLFIYLIYFNLAIKDSLFLILLFLNLCTPVSNLLLVFPKLNIKLQVFY